MVKLIGKAVRVGDKISACVSPTLVSRSNPLANINDVYNGILVNGNAIGDVMFYGRGAGKLPTASAVVSDIIDIATYLDHPVHNFHVWERLSDDEILPADELESRFYLRFASKPETLSGLPCPSVVSDETDNFAVVCGKTTLKSLRERYGDCTIMRLL